MVRELDGRRFAAELPARRCVACGESLVRGPALLAFEHALALELARSGSVGPEGFRFLRRMAGLDGKKLAALLDVTPNQVSRWENGRKPLERRAVALVSALATERIDERPRTIALLEALAAPHGKLPKRVQLDLSASSG